MTMLTLTTGTAFIMWLGEQITERGIGNGMSLIIFAGIVVGLAARASSRFTKRSARTNGRVLTRDLLLRCDDGGRRRVRRSRGARPAADSGSVCQARCRTPRAWRTVDASSAARQYGRRDPGDFRVVDPDVPADVRHGRAGQSILQRDHGCAPDSASRSTTCCTSSGSSSSAISTRRSSSIRTKLRTTCGSTAGSFPAFVRASVPPNT